MKKPKFGVVIAIGKSPMGEAYKKAVGKAEKVGPPAPPPPPGEMAPKGKRPKGKMPVAPKGEKDTGPKPRMPIAPKSGKKSTKPMRTDKKL
jgi:hypothetical protein